MTETSTDPKITCSAVHLSKNCTKKTHICYYKRESKKKMAVRIPQNIFLQNIFASRPQTATKKKKLIEEKAGCFYQNYKGYQIDEQKFLKKECDMRISRCVIPIE